MQTSAWLTLVTTLGVTGGLLLFPGSSTARFTPEPAAVVARVSTLAKKSDDPAVAADVAKELINQARARGGDVRLLGRAQAVLAPWWTEPTPPDAVRLMRATIKQSLHDFEGALVDLDALVRDDSQVQAQLTRATVLMVLSRHDEAEAACGSLRGKVESPVVMGCIAPLWALRGRAAQAIDGLERTLAVMDARHPLRAWLTSELGEVLAWNGATEQAMTRLGEALRLDPTDSYSRLLLARLLVEAGRAPEAVVTLKRDELNDAELLELVLASRAANDPNAERWNDELQERVSANRRRGETVHQREEARFALRVEGNAELAVTLAVENFATQREAADVQVLLETALAARNRRAAEPALEWMTRTGFADRRLVTLAHAVESLP